MLHGCGRGRGRGRCGRLLTEVGDGGGCRQAGPVPAEAGGHGVAAGGLGRHRPLQAAPGRQLQRPLRRAVDLLPVGGHLAVKVAVRRRRQALERGLGPLDQHLLDTVLGKVQLVGGDLGPAALDLLLEGHPRVEVRLEAVGLQRASLLPQALQTKDV